MKPLICVSMKTPYLMQDSWPQLLREPNYS